MQHETLNGKNTENNSPSAISVVLADDHPLFRQALRNIFEEVKDINVIGEAENGEEAVRKTVE